MLSRFYGLHEIQAANEEFSPVYFVVMENLIPTYPGIAVSLPFSMMPVH